jgi:hypothetical protein
MTLIRELSTSERSVRINEPDLVMDDTEKVNAYTRSGREDGVMTPVYLFHCAQICEVIHPADISGEGRPVIEWYVNNPIPTLFRRIKWLGTLMNILANQ